MTEVITDGKHGPGADRVGPPDAAADRTPTLSDRWFRAGVAVAALVGIALRVVVILHRRACGPDAPDVTACYSGLNDAAFYHDQANLMAHGHWFQLTNLGAAPGTPPLVPTAMHPPLYSLYLSVYSRLGVTSWDGHRFATIPIGVATIVLIALVARRVGGARAGLLAAGMAALYPLFWIDDTILMSEALFAMVCAAVAFAGYRLWDRPTLARSAVLGALIGLAALTRSEGLLLIVLVLTPITLGRPLLARKDRLRNLALGAVAAGLVMAPWYLYNAVRFEEPLVGGTGRVLQQAQCDDTYYGDLTGYWEICTSSGIPASYDESQVDPLLLDQAFDYLGDNAGRLPLVVLARESRLIYAYRADQQVLLNQVYENRGKHASVWERWAFLVVAPVGVLGLVLLWRRRVPISPLMGLVGTTVLATSFLASGLTRYRAPADVALVIGAAVTLSWLVDRRARRRAVAAA